MNTTSTSRARVRHILRRSGWATLAAAALLSSTPAVANAEPAHHWNACRYEDGSGQHRCVWDARHMGNGEGRSFKAIDGGTDDARYIYISHRRAHHLWRG